MVSRVATLVPLRQNTTIEVGNQTIVSDRITDNPEVGFYQLIYGLTVVVIFVTSLVRGFVFMRVTLTASSRLHDRLFQRLLRSPMSLFDTTPVGRLLNLFSRDLDEIDVRLPFTTETFLQNTLMILTSLFFVAMVFPWFLVPLVVIAAVFLFVRAVFSVGVRDLKRLENVTRAPTYSHVITTVQGLATIHAFGKEREFINRSVTGGGSVTAGGGDGSVAACAGGGTVRCRCTDRQCDLRWRATAEIPKDFGMSYGLETAVCKCKSKFSCF